MGRGDPHAYRDGRIVGARAGGLPATGDTEGPFTILLMHEGGVNESGFQKKVPALFLLVSE